jgi:hypothetical protein
VALHAFDGIRARHVAQSGRPDAAEADAAWRHPALHAGLTGDDRVLAGVTMIDSLEAAIGASVERSGERMIAVIPEGPYVVPVYRPASRAA